MQGMGVYSYLYRIFVSSDLFYFNPSTEEGKTEQQEMLSSVAVGDTILTTSGFYGVIIDMTDDTVIVEFGSNKN